MKWTIYKSVIDTECKGQPRLKMEGQRVEVFGREASWGNEKTGECKDEVYGKDQGDTAYAVVTLLM